MIIGSEDDLNKFIKNKIEENTNLEYKDPLSLDNKKEIAKDISAMANSNGGIIIYGLCEDNKDHKPTRIVGMENHQQKERIEQILQANVTPKIELEIKTISIKDQSKFVLIVNVPKSDIAPHQDHSDKDRRIYWRRNGFTTREMEHYEIDDLFFKRKKPILEIQLKKKKSENTAFDIILVNNGKVIGEKIMIQILMPGILEISGENWKKIKDIFSPRDMNPPGAQYKEYRYYQDKEPIFPKVPFESGIVYYPNKENLSKIALGFLITCKDAELNKGIVTFEGEESSIKSIDKEDVDVPFPPWVIKDGF